MMSKGNYRFAFLSLAIVALSAMAIWPDPLSLLHACSRQGDHSFIEYQSLCALEGSCLAGAYSRYDFHQPGPLYLYVLGSLSILLEPLTSGAGNFTTAQAIINLLCLLLSLNILVRLSPSATLAVAFIVTIALSLFRLDRLILWNYWNPPATVMPMLLLTLLAALTLKRIQNNEHSSISLLGCHALAAFTLQHHIASAPTALSILVFVQLAAMRKSRSPYTLGLTFLIVALLYSPIFFDLVRNQSDANPLAILLHFQSDGGGSQGGINALNFFSSFFHLPFRFFVSKDFALLCVLVSILPAFLKVKHIPLGRKSLLCINSIATLTTLAACFAITDGFQRYLLSFFYPVVLLWIALSATRVFELLRALIKNPIRDWWIVLMQGGVCIPAIIVGAQFYELPKTDCATGRTNLAEELMVQEGTLFRLRVTHLPSQQKLLSSLVRELQREGSQVCVDKSAKVFFETPLLCSRSEKEPGEELLITKDKPEEGSFETAIVRKRNWIVRKKLMPERPKKRRSGDLVSEQTGQYAQPESDTHD